MIELAITGTVNSGKSIYLNQYQDKSVRHTDELIHLGWDAATLAVHDWFDSNNIDVIVGVAVPRGLLSWLEFNYRNDLCPVKKIIYLTKPLALLTKDQLNMSKGTFSTFQQIELSLLQRGTQIEYL